MRAGAVVPPLFLDADEAVAVVTALLTAAGDATTGMVDASTRALAKLHHVLPAPVQRRAEAVRLAARSAALGRAPAVDPGRIATLAEACRDGESVRFDYVTRDGRDARRRVEPERPRHCAQRLVPHRLRPRPGATGGCSESTGWRATSSAPATG